MDLIAKHINMILVILIMLAPIVVGYAIEKQGKVELARAGQ